MTRRAVILGGTGTLADTAELLASQGWRVTVTGRHLAAVPERFVDLGIETIVANRNDQAATAAVLGAGVDLLVDGQCYSPEHAGSLARWSRACGSTVMLSAKAVYADRSGRHVNSPEPPVWEGPLTEDQPTMDFHGEPFASAQGYSRRRRAMGPTRPRPSASCRWTASGSRCCVRARCTAPTCVRHGCGALCCGARRSRAAADPRRRRRGVQHLRRGDRTHGLGRGAAASGTSAERGGRRPRTARDRVHLVAALAGGSLELLEVDGGECAAGIGRLPWTIDMVLDTCATRDLGVPDVTFAETAAAEVDWLTSVALRGEDGSWTLPPWIEADIPDFAAEEACLKRILGDDH